MSLRRRLFRLLRVVLALFLVVSATLTPAFAQNRSPVFLPLVSDGTAAPTHLLFRTRLTVRTPAQWRDLERLGVLVLDQGADWALLLVLFHRQRADVRSTTRL
jgi:hypothetical protein